ncbi:MAG: hypothetical protein Q6353_013570 [Candidatus Sigynarchaeum springense]
MARLKGKMAQMIQPGGTGRLAGAAAASRASRSPSSLPSRASTRSDTFNSCSNLALSTTILSPRRMPASTSTAFAMTSYSCNGTRTTSCSSSSSLVS